MTLIRFRTDEAHEEQGADGQGREGRHADQLVLALRGMDLRRHAVHSPFRRGPFDLECFA